MSLGFLTAAEFTLTFSAPAWIKRVASSSVRMPPPTVRGMKICSTTRPTRWAMISRPSWLAEMS
jgi:hypothetical protein